MITTKRLRSEPLHSDHASMMFPILQDERIYQYLPEKAPVSVEALCRRYEFLSSGSSPDGNEQWLNWILFELKSNKPIGFFQATIRETDCTIAYVLNPSYWGQGFASEAAEAMITHLFKSFDIRLIMAEINPQHEASQRLIKHLGFSFLRYDEHENDDLYEITKMNWFHHLSNRGSTDT